MADNGNRLGLYVFVLVLNLVFPVLGYTFTTFGTDYQDYDVNLDPDTLMMAGITIIGAESHNVTYNGEWVYFETQNKTTRFRFMDDILGPALFVVADGIAIRRQSAVSTALDTWLFAHKVAVKGLKTGKYAEAIHNATIIAEWEPVYNWSMFSITDGTKIFITCFSGSNITKSVYEDGTLNITVGQTFAETSNFNFWQFLGWYSSLMLGQQSWGLPPVFAWVIRLFSALSILAMILLAKEMIRL